MKTNSKRLGYIAGWLSVLINTLLFAVKYWAGTASQSVAMIADSWHTLSDSLTSIIVILGFRLAAMPPDKKHPFGHGRAESIAAIIIATLLAIVGFNFIGESITKFNTGETAQFGTTAIIIFAVSVVLKEAMAQFSSYAGKKLNSEALRADAWHHRSDAITTLVIVIGAIFGSKFYWIDSLLGFVISGMILYVTWEIMQEAVNSILGEKPNSKFESDVMKIAQSSDGHISDVHDIKTHIYGEIVEVTLHVCLPGNWQVDKAHEIAEKIEIALLEKKNIRATVHVDPEQE
ncbi:MAG: cation diffusion facilitator family transporter [Candidatus Kapabacteria bacterium]|jgi:cation diffusion facilitator family transporter|nr:cation diffusion facilitator family transporter [Candidatus Kapabacteria bacterium]